jgi:hypothetical protein
MDSATAAAWVAAAGAVAAALFAIWSAVSSHRAASSAAEAVALERGRRHDELTPSIELNYQGWHDSSRAYVWFTNHGPLDYTSVAFAFAMSPSLGPIARLAGTTSGEVGPLSVGERQRLLVDRHAEPFMDDSGTLHLILTCSNDQGTWTLPAEVQIPPPGV